MNADDAAMEYNDRPEIKTGCWRNYGGGFLNSFQCTTTQYWRIELLLALLQVGIFLCLVDLVHLILLHVAYKWQGRQQAQEEEQRLMGGNHSIYGLPQGNPPRDGYSRENSPRQGLPSKKALVPYWFSFCLTTVAILLTIFTPIANMLASDDAAYPSGLVKSENCGLWVLDREKADNATYEGDIEYQSDKERRAAEYARLCYRGTSVANPEACSIFVERKLHYRTFGVDCPFAKGLCAGGPTAMAFDTGPISTTKLGLNIPKSPIIRRKTTCAPLEMHSFVEEVGLGPGGLDWQYQYKYGEVTYKNESGDGSIIHQPYTFLMPADPFRWGVGTYSVWIYEYIKHEFDHYWTPIPQLMPPDDTYLTLMFIVSCHILYRATWNNDYIFPSPERDPHYAGLFVNPDPRPHPLACIDEVEVCSDDDKSSCSPVVNPARDSKDGYGYEFARLALKHSKTYDSIQYRMGTALLAQESVGQFRSRPLRGPSNDKSKYSQWILEAQALFETSLARLQFDALDIAMGLHSDKGEPYHQDTAEWAQQGKLCGMFKIRLQQGFRNINLLTPIIYVIILVIIVVLQCGVGRSFPDKEMDKYFGTNMTVFSWLCDKLGSSCSRRQAAPKKDNGRPQYHDDIDSHSNADHPTAPEPNLSQRPHHSTAQFPSAASDTRS